MSVDTVFYAWQSWRAPEVTRNVIEYALKKAASLVNRAAGTPVVVDRDTRGLPGAPHIPDAIHQKIKSAVAFVADVTPVQRLVVEGREHDVPNPNVMIEAGLAISEHGSSRMICVLNTALGDSRFLPFDLDKHRILPYHLAERLDGETEQSFWARRKAARDKLVGDLASALSLILLEQTTDFGLIDLCGDVFRGSIERVAGNEWACRLVSPLRAVDMDLLALAARFERATHRYVSVSATGIA